jgi:primosomal protein DnaI
VQPINETLSKLINREDFKKRYEQLKNEVLSHPEVHSFIRKHQDVITEGAIDRSLIKLYEFIGQSKNCNQCPSLEQCRNILKGYHPHLVVQGNMIDIQYERCPTKIKHDERKRQEQLIQSIFVPREMLKASFSDIELVDDGKPNESRIKAVELAEKFVSEYEPRKKMKGLYLYGSFGVGKTYILGAIANALAKKNIPSLLVYVPEFFRELKSSLQDQTINEKLDYVKKVPVLMLDDIGAESMSSWLRDDILGPLLQYRMMENLPTFFTSNFDFQQLAHHLTYSQRGEEEKVKAARIMERIQYLAYPVEIKGKNRRVSI